ncbi:PR domain zinc finger protein 8-like [Ornithodoros turicata]|uniref:PR domain zinc finger protein 8-like n=1 Tax=Ornithodoros turicata TaxID=34597 RepID=UPI00313A4A7F
MGERRWSGVTTQEAVREGTCFGPLPSSIGGLDPLASMAWFCTDRTPTPTNTIKVSPKEDDASQWLCQVTPARGPHEQTVEVIAQDGQLFLRAMRDLHRGDQLLAWFGKELANVLRLPEITPTLVDGDKAYQCALCNEAFCFPFPVISHLMYRCPARNPGSLLGTSPERQLPAPMSRRVKGFDIASLTDTAIESPNTPPPSEHLSADRLTPPDSEQTALISRRKPSPDAPALPDVKRPSLADQLRASIAESKSSQRALDRHTSLPEQDFKPNDLSRKRKSEDDPTSFPPQSAFKKVDKTDRTAPQGLGVSASFPYPLPGLCPPFLTMSTLDSRLKSDEDGGRRFLAAAYPPLVPYMPPSLAALSLPSQNWCAKCQASFRMTSDLVYHMRSHHKREVDPAKKRREEKLRCHICHETFRERHHLTRHMTSHQ